MSADIGPGSYVEALCDGVDGDFVKGGRYFVERIVPIENPQNWQCNNCSKTHRFGIILLGMTDEFGPGSCHFTVIGGDFEEPVRNMKEQVL